jgi:hypothetical protein
MFTPRILLVLSLGILPVWASASPDEIADDAKATADFRQRRAAALAALRANNVDQAESELEALGHGRTTGGSGAVFDLAQNLLGLAYEARGAGELPVAQRTARRALKVVEKAEKASSNDPKRLAQLQLLRATLIEEFLGNTEEAKSAIKDAARLDPKNDDARRQINKLQPEDEKAKLSADS